ncbi:MAG: hypothetical protein HC828_22310, partial [Blastochloris sp.]|nr:hypothetical protein [Blastochloris sp.]
MPNPNPSGNPVLQLSNSDGGVLIANGPQNTSLTGNTISGNQLFGVRLSQVTATTLKSNFIGLNLARNGTVGNAGAGIDVQNSVNTSIGGASGDELNVISGNAGPGIRISGSDTVSTTVDGNYIGVSLASGQYTADAGNSGPGVLLENGPRQTTIGGFGNRIAANTGPGVQISATLPNTVTLTTLLANTIGFAPNGNQAPFELPNSEGVVIAGDGVSSVDVLSNTIRFNANDGIAVTAATTVTLQYNAAISDNDGRGVYVAEGAERVQIRDNTIESNGAAAILLEDAATERVTMIDNQIARNVEPVTLLGTTAYNGTPPDTATPGPNHDIDPPFGIRVDRNGLISGFVYTGTFELNNDDPVFTPASACVEGPNGPCRIAVYQSDPELSSPDEQPWTRLGFQGGDDLIPASDGLFSGELSSPVPINGQLLFAATDGFGNTSAFAAFTVTPGLALTPLDPADAALESAPSQTVTYTLRLSNTGTLDLPNVALFTGGTLAGWDATVTPNQVAIAAGGERVLTVTLDLPVGTDLNAAAGIIDTTVVHGKCNRSGDCDAGVQHVLEQAVLRVQPVRG